MEQDKDNNGINPENTAFQINNIDEEIEFDDNIDIDALQAQLKQHIMDTENIEYTPEPSVVTPEPQPVEEKKEDISSLLDIPTFTSQTPAKTPQVPDIGTPTTPLVVPNQPAPPQEKLKLQEGEKKYVIYIEPDNIDFIENLSIKDRKKLINKVLHEQDEASRKRREMRERAKFTRQIIIMVLTVTIALPVFFVLLNKSIEITILNYQQAQQNFVKLYKEQGKIKSYKSFQNHFR